MMKWDIFRAIVHYFRCALELSAKLEVDCWLPAVQTSRSHATPINSWSGTTAQERSTSLRIFLLCYQISLLHISALAARHKTSTEITTCRPDGATDTTIACDIRRLISLVISVSRFGDAFGAFYAEKSLLGVLYPQKHARVMMQLSRDHLDKAVEARTKTRSYQGAYS